MSKSDKSQKQSLEKSLLEFLVLLLEEFLDISRETTRIIRRRNSVGFLIISVEISAGSISWVVSGGILYCNIRRNPRGIIIKIPGLLFFIHFYSWILTTVNFSHPGLFPGVFARRIIGANPIEITEWTSSKECLTKKTGRTSRAISGGIPAEVVWIPKDFPVTKKI